MFLRLQPYRKYSLKLNGAKKFQPRLYGPYKVTIKVGEVAYELDLPEGSKIHNLFHVSFLEKEIGKMVVALKDVPPIDDEGNLDMIPEEIFQVR